jgi:hypothetical protein
MAFEIFGIDNENNFYPTAFLSSALETEVADAIARWNTDGAKDSPARRLEAIAGSYTKILERLRSSDDGAVAIELQRNASEMLLQALGYAYVREGTATAQGALAPTLARVADPDGRDRLWILEAPLAGTGDEAADPLSLSFLGDQFVEGDRDRAAQDASIDEVISDGVFALDAPPRYIIVISPFQLVLVDRNKWSGRAVLRFDLIDIFTRADTTTLNAMACFVSREARVPEAGIPLADRLEEEAQRHANAVTSSLKRTVREAIEILGNEVLAVTGGKYPSGPRKGVWIESQDLTVECLRYMYRLLFLFYAEANPKLGIMPVKDPAYRSGYSLESLRALETTRLRTAQDREGTYIWDSLQRLLGLMYEGLEPKQIGSARAFSLPRVRVSLLDPGSTPILSKISVRNKALQSIIRLLSLKQDKSGSGRISYAQLGIGQLGAVYETLISFTGFVAKADLIELKLQKTSKDTAAENESAGEDASDADDDGESEISDAESDEQDHSAARTDRVDPLEPSYFVERSRAEEFDNEEIVYDGPQPRIYPKGSFIYRLAGRDRQKSASFYTPEPLARLLVKHALMERCRDMPADEILDLKILEPAMGSAAFLVETTNQLADLYLDRKQAETGKRIPQEAYFHERQKVRAYLADRNCFGVDLNPIAVELGQISLWLNSLHAGVFSPWFGDQLHAGNSLVGARRAAYEPRLLTAKAAKDRWLSQKPEEIGWRGKLEDGHVWQFLLPVEAMAGFDKEKSIKEFAGAAQEAIRTWRHSGFFDAFDEHEVRLLQRLSKAADALFDAVADDLARARASSNDEIKIWPDKLMPGVSGEDFQTKLARLRVLQGDEHVSNSLPYQRLKTTLDAWCALWLWPLDQAKQLPSRKEWLRDLSMILLGGVTSGGEPTLPEDLDGAKALEIQQEDWIARQEEADRVAAELPSTRTQSDLFQSTDIDALVKESAWLEVARKVALRERFVHFDLIFADVLRARGGFDLIVGNPPWAKPSWNEGLILADIDPKHMGLSASDAKKVLAEALTRADGEARFLAEFVSTSGAMAVTSSEAMNPFAGGGSNNLYACFIDLAFRLCSDKGSVALIHQDAHLISSGASPLRTECYFRLRKHFGFRNELKSHNFAEIGNTREFSVNIYGAKTPFVNFECMYPCFLPKQVEASYAHNGAGEIPPLKNASGKWSVEGHRNRIIAIDAQYLAVIHELLGGAKETVDQARLIRPFGSSVADIFRRLAKFGAFATEPSQFEMSGMWTEGTADANPPTIKRDVRFPEAADVTILSAPTIYVGDPLYKSPRQGCRNHRDYSVVDKRSISEDYFPRNVYSPALGLEEYKRVLPRKKISATLDWIDSYRVACRNFVPVNQERTLLAAIIPPRVGHIDTIESAGFENESDTLNAAGLLSSLVVDFLVRSIGQTHFRKGTLSTLPWASVGSTAASRVLRLNCLTKVYGDLWNRHASNLSSLPWSSDDPRLAIEGPVEGPAKWDHASALRTEFARRLALVEIDVLVAQAFGLNLEQLIEVYRIYFPVLQENEAGTWYDQQGRIVWTCSKGLPGVGWLDERGRSPGRKAWEKMLEELSGKAAADQLLTCTAKDDALPGGPHQITRRFQGPFTSCDRVEDYKRAWAHFERLKAEGAEA